MGAREMTNFKYSSRMPHIGQRLKLNLLYVRQDEPDENNNRSTPMTKIRYDPLENQWTQVPSVQAGMYVFFDQDIPDEATQFEITSIIPSRTGCYAKAL